MSGLVVDALGSQILPILTVLAVAIFAIKKTRFLSFLMFAYAALFLVLHLVGRLERNFEQYYIGPVIFLLPFAAGAIAEAVAKIYEVLRRRKHVMLGRISAGVLSFLFLWLLDPVARAKVLAEGYTYKVDETVREVRDFLHDNADPEDYIAMDYTEDVGWLAAEITTAETQDNWAYYTNHRPQPVHGLPSTEEGFAEMREWVASGFSVWVAKKHPKWIVTTSDARWLRVRGVPHYRAIALRSALGRESFYDGLTIDVEDEILVLHKVFSNERFFIFRGEYSVSPLSLPQSGENMLMNGTFADWRESRLHGWQVLHGASVSSDEDPDEGTVAVISARSPDDSAGLFQTIPIPRGMSGRLLRLRVVSKCDDVGKLGINLYYYENGERRVIAANHPGDGEWHTIESDFVVPTDMGTWTVELLLGSRPGISTPAKISHAFLGPVE